MARRAGLPAGFTLGAVLEVGLHGLTILDVAPEFGCGVAGFGLLGAHGDNGAAALNHHQRVALGLAVAIHVNINGCAKVDNAERVGAVGGLAWAQAQFLHAGGGHVVHNHADGVIVDGEFAQLSPEAHHGRVVLLGA